jgi:hypothetical protein
MSTRDIVLAVKKGDRVVYVANDGVEYNAVALDIAHFGYNQAVRASGAFLNLAYFDALGSPVKISAAPLLGSEADDEHFGMAAYDAAKRDVRYHGSTGEDKEALVHEHFDRLKATPRTIGWRVGSVGEPVSVSKSDIPEDEIPVTGSFAGIPLALTTRVPSGVVVMHPSTFSEAVAHNVAQFSTPAVPSELERSYEATQPDVDEANAKSKLETLAAEGNGGAQLTLDALAKSSGVDGDAGDWTQAGQDATGFPVERGSDADITKPSAADLDAVAAEQDTAIATSAEPTADDPAAQNDSANSPA